MEGAEPGGAEARDRAAAVVQRTFRRFINVRIYKYYRNLVNFRNRGDPGLLLRCINPSEAALVADRASGAVVRFRLGGSVFPPIVYYKVYLRNAVTDLGAFAPRDYTVGKPDQFYMLRRHNDGCVNEVRAQAVRDVTHQVDTSLWYHRFENNGWRPIANKHLHAHDHVTRTTAARRNPDFHHMGEVRKLVATKKREDKKRQWMERMFKPSETHASKDTLDLGSLGGSGSGLDGRSWDADLITPEEEMEMDAFVERLDFEDYFSHWVSLATSVSAADLLATAEMSR